MSDPTPALTLAQTAALHIRAGTHLLDLSGAAHDIQPELPHACTYQALHLAPTQIDKGWALQNPASVHAPIKTADIVAMLGPQDLLHQPEKWLKPLAQQGKTVLCSHHTAGPEAQSLAQFIAMVSSCGMAIETQTAIDPQQHLFKLRPKRELAPITRTPRVHVLSHNNVGNFGDRLGYFLINHLLPPQAMVTWGQLNPFEPVPDDLDLLIVGIGNSLFGPLVHRPLIQAVQSARHSIGIFGTQYQPYMPLQHMHELLDALTWWYARHEDDILLYGRHRKNVSHLGDWLINAFAITQAQQDALLRVGDEVWNNLPIDRTIQQIQTYQQVFSTRLHPLLCALTSAQQVGYTEQRDAPDKAIVSGKFRAMLIDIFGTTYPENRMWQVDKEKVIRYKKKIHANKEAMRQHVRRILTT